MNDNINDLAAENAASFAEQNFKQQEEEIKERQKDQTLNDLQDMVGEMFNKTFQQKEKEASPPRQEAQPPPQKDS